MTIVCVKPVGQAFTDATAETVVQRGDLLLVAGEAGAAKAFANLRGRAGSSRSRSSRG